ncbi:MAG: hypothetical protein HZB55_21485 [Deltaproteobacteria bacterium]|nr:hypothetical protein [Deltaproteobacteria bacterium]
MRIFDVRDHFNPKYGEYIIGSREIERHSVYLVVGEVAAGETRTLAPDGHDEILLLLSGEASLEGIEGTRSLAPQGAVYLEPQETATLRAITACRYVVAGAHAAHHDH